MSELKKHSYLSLNLVKKVWHLLPLSRRFGIVKLLALMIFGTILEMLGVSMVVPVITVLTQPDLLTRSSTMSRLLDYAGNPNQHNLIIGVILALVGVYLIKNIYLGVLAWRQSSFVHGLQSEIAQSLFGIYLRQPYTFHLQNNSAHLLRNVQSEVSMFINGIIMPLMLVLAEGLVAFGLFGMLLYIEPTGTFSVFGLLIIAGGAFYLLTRHRLIHWGKERQFHEGARIKLAQESFGSVKDVKILGREANFLNEYRLHTEKSMGMSGRQYTIQQLPRLWLELLAVSGMAILIITMTIQSKPLSNFIPTLALFAAISFRLMPSASRILNSIQQLRFSAPVVDLLIQEFRLQKQQAPESLGNGAQVLKEKVELINVSFKYPDTIKPAIKQINMTIRKGEMVGFIGESGSGKSTLIDLILGLFTPLEGQVLVDEQDINLTMRAWQDQIGYVPQTIYLTDDTLMRNIAFGIPDEEIDHKAVKNAIKLAQLEQFLNGLPHGMNTLVGERGVRLSGGQRQRIGIARALYHDPAVLVLDEATSALDNQTETEIMQAVVRLHGKKTILIVAHRLSTVNRCDRIFKLENGQIAAQITPSEIKI